MDLGLLMLESSSKLLLPLGKFFRVVSFLEHLTVLNRLFPKKVELQALMKYYDVNGDGKVGYEEFLSGLR
jgi:Ca2+-binding EF-hand superfamily protein